MAALDVPGREHQAPSRAQAAPRLAAELELVRGRHVGDGAHHARDQVQAVVGVGEPAADPAGLYRTVGLIRGFADRNIFQITFTPICLGVLLAHVLHGRRGFDRFASWLGRPWMSMVALVVLALACNAPVAAS